MRSTIREAGERMSERADTAYSPRFREEEHSATDERMDWMVQDQLKSARVVS